MSNLPFRIIARLDIKGENVVKGRQMEGLKVVGTPGDLSCKYAQEGADELLYMDVAASLYGRGPLLEIIRQASQEIFIPLTVGGGVRTLEDIEALLKSGADKVAINTAAIQRPEFLTEAAERFGSQAIVASIETRWDFRSKDYRCFTDSGREPSAWLLHEWITEVQNLGAGEVLVTAIEADGSCSGMSAPIVMQAWLWCEHVPLLVGGGWGAYCQASWVTQHADGLVVGAALHKRLTTIPRIKKAMRKDGIMVR